jgi:diguanylate cyclase (GGDEF)-like protein
LILIVVGVLRKRVAHPIRQMRLASDHVSSGDYLAVADGKVGLPVDQDNEIGVFAKSFKSMAKKVGDNSRLLEQVVEERTLELRVANSELERLSFQDGLTASFNRRGFDRDLATALQQAVVGDSVYSLLLCDVDHFKRYNDTYGHVAGDKALRLIVDEICRCVPFGRVYRYGGEEIAVLFEASAASVCGNVGEEIVRAIANLGLKHRESPYGSVTISAGLVVFGKEVRTAEDAISQADALLYQAKEGGRARLAYDRSGQS